MAFVNYRIKSQKIKLNVKMNLFSSLSIPYILMLFLLVVLPFFFILFYAFTNTTDSRIYLTLHNFVEFVSDPNFRFSLWLSLYFALLTTVFCILLGYPVAYFISKAGPRMRNAIIFLITAPMWINMLLRVIAWQQILDVNGPIAAFLRILGFGEVKLLGTDFAVVLGMVYVFLPFMIIPIYTQLLKINDNLLEASQDLGANQIKTFRKVTLPLSMPGVISGITMVFLPAATSLIVPKKLGAGDSRYNLIGQMIERYFIQSNNYYAGSAISLILALVILIMVFFVNRFDKTIVKEKFTDNSKEILK